MACNETRSPGESARSLKECAAAEHADVRGAGDEILQLLDAGGGVQRAGREGVVSRPVGAQHPPIMAARPLRHGVPSMQTEQMGRAGRAMLPKGEDRYRVRRFRRATFFTSRQAFDDLTIVVKRFPGVAEGQVFLLVHGLGVSSRYFQPAAAELAKFGRVFLVDLPGYGAAPDPKQRRDPARPRRRAGRLPQGVRAQRPGRRRALDGGAGGRALWPSTIPVPRHGSCSVAPTMPPEARTFWRAAGRLLHDALREPPVVFWIACSPTHLVRTGLRYLLQQTPHMLEDRLEEDLPTITVPTLVLNGDRDTIVPVAWAEETAALVPGRDGPRSFGAPT